MSEVASETTMQVRPQAGRDLERDVTAAAEAMRAQPGIVQVTVHQGRESARLLEPWLGSGLSIEQLPVPRVVVARVQPGTTLDLAGPDAPGDAGAARRRASTITAPGSSACAR